MSEDYARKVSRSPERAALLGRLADEMLLAKQRSQQQRGIRSVNRHFSEPPPTPPTDEERAKDDIVEALKFRLGRRDQTGGGSGEPG